MVVKFITLILTLRVYFTETEAFNLYLTHHTPYSNNAIVNGSSVTLVCSWTEFVNELFSVRLTKTIDLSYDDVYASTVFENQDQNGFLNDLSDRATLDVSNRNQYSFTITEFDDEDQAVYTCTVTDNMFQTVDAERRLSFTFNCTPGLYNNDCPALCKDGYYGSTCGSACSTNCVNTACNKSSGFCNEEGCTTGYSGDKCDQALSTTSSSSDAMGAAFTEQSTIFQDPSRMEISADEEQQSFPLRLILVLTFVGLLLILLVIFIVIKFRNPPEQDKIEGSGTIDADTTREPTTSRTPYPASEAATTTEESNTSDASRTSASNSGASLDPNNNVQ